MERLAVAQEPDDYKIELYLVGALAEDETERLDEMSLTDDIFADRLRNVENDLADAYARGELSGALAEVSKRITSHHQDEERRSALLRHFTLSRSPANQ